MTGTPFGSSDQREQYAALMRQFGEGWETGDAAKIADVFTAAGALIPDPFGAEVKGQRAVQQYWKDIAFEQSQIAFRFGEIYLAGLWFATEFKCTFRRRRTGAWVDVRGAVFCETAGGKVTEMRIYYHRVVDAR